MAAKETDPRTVLGVQHSALALDVPAGACDCHVHVFGPSERYPFSPDRRYTPGEASVEDLLALQRALRFDRVVIVHPSPYGVDNSCTIDALRGLGARARGVAVIDETTSEAALREMDRAGMRGVRVNLETFGLHDPAVASQLLKGAAARVAPLGWHVQTYTNLTVLAALQETIRALPVPLVVDHFGHADAAKGIAQPGFDALLALVAGGKAYVKISGAYRISKQVDRGDVAALARALIAANPDRIVWGTDWPHPGGGRGGPREDDAIEPFLGEDDGAALNRLAAWAPDPVLRRKILVDNPARLYDF
jgi:predicted TIM-barrel fold metal-dependent hydrolase